MSRREPFAPSTLLVLDFIEFVHRAVAKPVPGKYHEYFSHHHLTFDQEAGQEDFRATINRLFSRNGLAFEMLTSGRIVRVLPPVLAEELRRTTFNSGDRTLDVLLEECRLKFSDRNPLVRREALERLWDAWERLKSLPESTGEPGNKEAADLGIAVTTDTGAGAFLQGKAILVFNIVSVWARHLDLIGTAPDHHVHDERCGDELQGGDDVARSLPVRLCPGGVHRPAHCRVAHTARLRGLVDLSRRAATGAAAAPRSGCSTAWAVA